jgi:hypothetical protein
MCLRWGEGVRVLVTLHTITDEVSIRSGGVPTLVREWGVPPCYRRRATEKLQKSDEKEGG